MNKKGKVYWKKLLFIFIMKPYKFKIDEGSMTYQILFLTMPIYKKVVYPDQIIQVRIKRFGWGTKGAIIQVKKGLNIRIVHFVPETIFEELENFAIENDIVISGTNR